MKKISKSEKIRKEIVSLLEKNQGLKYEEIQDKVHANLPNGILSPDSVRCPHTSWKQYEWQHEIRRVVDKISRIRKMISLDKSTNLYFLKFDLVDSLADAENEDEIYRRIRDLPDDYIDRSINELDRILRTPERKSTLVNKFERNQSLPALIKRKYHYKCQLCGFTFKKRDGSYYAEVAHIRPLNEEGLDNSSNMLVLCPNHHKILDLADSEVISQNSESLIFLIGTEKLEARF